MDFVQRLLKIDYKNVDKLAKTFKTYEDYVNTFDSEMDFEEWCSNETKFKIERVFLEEVYI